MAEVIGDSQDGIAVQARSVNNHALFSRSETGNGVIGHTNGDPAAGTAGVFGEHLRNGTGVAGRSQGGFGVAGVSGSSHGVHGQGLTGGFFEGGAPTSQGGRTMAGVHAVNKGNGPAIFADQGNGTHAGFFSGKVSVDQSIDCHDVIIMGADCAEDFETMSSAQIEPGTVMAIGDDARLVESDRAYDKRVAGIVSGAGDSKPGIVLGKDASLKNRVPLALIGKVFCKTDATYAPIEVGDLLTTSPTQGHAMKAEDPSKAFGAVIGKALAPLREGRSLLPILVALQ